MVYYYPGAQKKRNNIHSMQIGQTQYLVVLK